MAPGQSFIINLRREKFEDVKVRKALGLMFNFEWSNKTLFYDLYARINSFWENSDMSATSFPSTEELNILKPLKNLLPEGVLSENVASAAVSSTKQLDRKNLRLASKLLDEAGWEVGDDGLRKNNKDETLDVVISVSYTHLTLPTIYSV